MTTPDVRIRLSAEGVEEVVAALRKVQTESGRAAKSGAKAFGDMNASLVSMGNLLELVGTAIAAIGITRFVSEANDLAEVIQNLKARLPSTAKDLNAIDVELRRMKSSLPEAARGLTTFFQATQDAAELGGEAADKFKRLGLTKEEIDNFARQDLPARMETVAKASLRLGDANQRSAAFIAALGTRAAALVPLFDDLAHRGMAGLREQAVGLASDIDDEMVKSMGDANDAMDDMNLEARGLASQFLTGVAPALTRSMAAVRSDLTSGQAGWRLFGELVGNVLGGLVVRLTAWVDFFQTAGVEIVKSAIYIGRGIKAALSGNFDKAQLEVEAIRLSWEKAAEDQAKRQQVMIDKAKGTSGDATPAPSVFGSAEDAAERAAAFDRNEKAKLAAAQAARDVELKITETGLKLNQEAEDRAFAEGLLSITAYYAKRRDIAVQGINAQIAALQARAVELRASNDPNSAAELAKTNGEIRRLVKERVGVVEDGLGRERAAFRDLAKDQLEADSKVLEAQGRHHDVVLRQIAEEAEARRLALIKGGVSPEDAAKRADDRAEVFRAQERFSQISLEANRVLADLGSKREEIRRQVEAGLLSEFEGEKKVTDLENDRIATLRLIGRALQDAAGTPEEVAASNQFQASLDGVEIALKKNREELKRYKAASIDAAQSGLVDYLSHGIDEAHGLRDAIAEVIQVLRRMAAELFVAKLFQLLGGIHLGGGGGSTFGVDSAPAGLPGGAGGGGDVVAARAFPGGVNTAGAVDLAAALRASDFGVQATGGSSARVQEPTEGDASEPVHIIIDAHPDLVIRTMASPAGRRIQINNSAKDARAHTRALGAGR